MPIYGEIRILFNLRRRNFQEKNSKIFIIGKMVSHVAEDDNSWRNTIKSKSATSFNAKNCKIAKCTDFLHRSHRGRSKKNSLKINLGIFANFENLQSDLKRRQMCQFVEKFEKKFKFSKLAK